MRVRDALGAAKEERCGGQPKFAGGASRMTAATAGSRVRTLSGAPRLDDTFGARASLPRLVSLVVLLPPERTGHRPLVEG